MYVCVKTLQKDLAELRMDCLPRTLLIRSSCLLETIDTPHIPVTSGSPDSGVSRRLSRMLATNPSRNHMAAIMACTVSYDGSNIGIQVGQNNGHITNQFPCLRDLRTTNPHHDKDRIQNTNGGLLKDSYRWILDNEEFQQWQNN
ncbi:unnamed protein product [Penicillium salamii]|nr:unnamed protein product [Penicillium salamii]CAG8264937.1 unnamed protein product [Penicillium salamii]